MSLETLWSFPSYLCFFFLQSIPTGMITQTPSFPALTLHLLSVHQTASPEKAGCSVAGRHRGQGLGAGMEPRIFCMLGKQWSTSFSFLL